MVPEPARPPPRPPAASLQLSSLCGFFLEPLSHACIPFLRVSGVSIHAGGDVICTTGLPVPGRTQRVSHH